eukprot:752102-Hanusia_phi.AAC.2
MTVQDVQKRFPTASMNEIEEFIKLQQQNIALLSQIRQKRSEYSRAIRNNIGEIVFTHTAGSPKTIEENGKTIVVRDARVFLNPRPDDDDCRRITRART